MASVIGTAGNDFIHVAGDGLSVPPGFNPMPLATNLADQIFAADGDDVVYSGGGADSVIGGRGNDTLYGGDGNDTISGDAGNDLIFGGFGNDVLAGGDGDDTLVAGNGNDTLSGGAGNDVLIGTGGSVGSLMGLTGVDTLAGGIGDDVYYLQYMDSATIVEAAGEGIDTLHVSASWSGPSANLRLAANVENLVIAATRSGFVDPSFYANDLNNTITSAPSAIGSSVGHVMHGLGGNDVYVVDSQNDQTVELQDGGTDTVRSAIAWTLAANVENLTLEGMNLRGEGNRLANVITGGIGADTLISGGGSDTLIGGTGGDTYVIDFNAMVVGIPGLIVVEASNAGRDRVISLVSGLTLWDNVEDLELQTSGTGRGNALDNQITASRALPSISTAGNFFYGEDGKDQIFGSNFSDGLYGGNGNDSLSGQSGNDTLFGQAGNDLLYAGVGVDSLFGGDGNDTYFIGGADDRLIEAETGGIDTVQTNTSHALGLWFENLTLTGAVGLSGTGNAVANTLRGTTGNDTLRGMDGDDQLFGNEGDDTLDGGNGNDALFGGAGNDHLIGGAGVDSLVGGGGNDTYETPAGDTIVELIGGGTDTVRSLQDWVLANHLENLVLLGLTGLRGTGNGLANQLTGTGQNDTLDGGAGNDTLIGLLGNDQYRVTSGDLIVESLNGGIDTVFSSGSFRLAENVENLTLQSTSAVLQLNGFGNDLNNILLGTIGIDVLSGLGGNDTLQGFGGDDTLSAGTGADSLIGGDGNDVYVISGGDDTLSETATGGTDTVQTDSNYTLQQHFENLTLTGLFGRIATGNTAANTLQGGVGNDILRGSDGDDVLAGNNGDDSLDGGTGIDQMFGGAGNDRFLVDNTQDQVNEFADSGIDIVSSTVSYRLLANIENLILLGTAGLSGTGNQLTNTLVGTSGDDTLNGGLGVDRLEGGGGNDRYVVDSASDAPVELANGGSDTVESTVNFVLGSHLEHLVLVSSVIVGGTGLAGSGNALDNSITGTRGIDTLFGDAGNDRLTGAGSDDVLNGGAGNDAFVISSTGTQVVEGLNGGIDTVISATHLTVLAANVENLIFSPTQAPVVGGASATGNALNNTMTSFGVRTAFHGLGGNDTLTGGAANDSLFGGDGNDVLNGGAGVNSLFGGVGDDIYVINAAQQVVDERVSGVDPGSVDEVRSSVSFSLGLANYVENLELLGSTGLRGDGNGLDNRIGGTAQGDTLSGFIGNDSLLGRGGDDVLNGGIGADQMIGGIGNDTYFVDSTLDQVIENANQGIDTVQSVVAFILAANVENLFMSATPTTSNATGQGNELDNTLTRTSGFGSLVGLAGNDTLIGAGGQDTLVGGIGNDRMVGGGGDDRYVVEQFGDVVVEAANGGYDWVTSVISYAMADNVERLNLLSGAIGLTGTGNAGANLIEGTAFNDTFFGGGAFSGDDTILGGNGDDTIVGGVSQNVLLQGDAGNDSFSFALRDLNEIVPYTPNITVNGGTGTDTLDLTNYSRDGVTIDMAAQTISIAGFMIAGIEAIITGEGADTITNARTASGGLGNDSLTGTALADQLFGGNGNDTLDGGGSDDLLVGGIGDDVFIVDRASDIVEELLNGGTDTIRSSVSYTLGDDLTTGHVENLVLLGAVGLIGTGNRLDNVISGTNQGDTLRGGDGNDTLIGLGGTNFLQGGAGNDRLEGGAETDRLDGGIGADTMIGGAGTDFYRVDNVGDVVTELAGGGEFDRVETGLASHTLAANVETLVGTLATGATLNGNDGNNFVDGASGNDTLSGLGGDDQLRGGDGNDVLYGGAGADYLDGGAGVDTLAGGADDDIYAINSGAELVIELAGGGNDTVTGAFAAYTLSANVENLISSFTGQNVLFGNEENNNLTSSSGNDFLYGLDGDDVLVGGAGIDYLYGGAGNDTLYGRAVFVLHTDIDELHGGAGDDVYAYASLSTFIFEAANEGIDTVFSLLPTYVLGVNIENAQAFTSANAVLLGNSLDNSLGGLSGNDTLIGGGGNDTLTGNTGADTFVFNSLVGSDRVTDMMSGSDRLVFSASVMQIGNLNTTIDNGLATTTGGWSGANELVIFSQNVAGLTAAQAAAGAGTASGAVTTGQRSIMVFDNGTDSAIFQFTAQNNDSVVSASELTLLVTLQGTSATLLTDYIWGG